jgi:hypothetical protein
MNSSKCFCLITLIGIAFRLKKPFVDLPLLTNFGSVVYNLSIVAMCLTRHSDPATSKIEAMIFCITAEYMGSSLARCLAILPWSWLWP